MDESLQKNIPSLLDENISANCVQHLESLSYRVELRELPGLPLLIPGRVLGQFFQSRDTMQLSPQIHTIQVAQLGSLEREIGSFLSDECRCRHSDGEGFPYFYLIQLQPPS